MGLIFIGGEHAFTGMPDDLLPVTVAPGNIVDKVDPKELRPTEWYQTIPTDNGLAKMMKLDKEQANSITIWNELNGFRSRAKLTGYNRMAKKDTGTVYAWVTNAIQTVTAGNSMPDKAADPGADPLLVGHQIGDGSKGRVLAFAASDTFLWEKLGQPKTKQGTEIHTRFWKNCVLWLAHQDEEEGQAYIRPSHRQLKVGSEQTLCLGVKLLSGRRPERGINVRSSRCPRQGRADRPRSTRPSPRPSFAIKTAEVLFPRVRRRILRGADQPEERRRGRHHWARRQARDVAPQVTAVPTRRTKCSHQRRPRLPLPPLDPDRRQARGSRICLRFSRN